MNSNEYIRQTHDGSFTLYSPIFKETYHSIHGALQESQHVYIENGLKLIGKKEINILEVSFGTGLNTWLTAKTNENISKTINYTCIEPFPITYKIAKNYISKFENLTIKDRELFLFLHKVEWGRGISLGNNFNLLKLKLDLSSYKPNPSEFDLIYYDAFSPNSQAEMWKTKHFIKLFDSLMPDGILVTYCAKGQLKRDLSSCGFEVNTVQGPPNKREMIVAKKNMINKF